MFQHKGSVAFATLLLVIGVIGLAVISRPGLAAAGTDSIYSSPIGGGGDTMLATSEQALPIAAWPQSGYPMAVGLADAPVILSAPPATTAPPPSYAATPMAQVVASQEPTAAPQSPAPAQSSPGRAQRKATPGDYNLLGKPSISVATIELVLKQFNSPAIGDGQTFYDLGVKYGVDPAFMLAFYVHESAAGTAGAAVATKSVGNIICAGWGGACIGRFRAYNSYTQAAEDWYQLITGPLYIGGGLTTPDAITHRYAPSSDNNDPNGYAKTVERLVDQWRAAQP